MKLSRRGKHTKRAGKHLGYKSKSKKFRASKRYHRGRGVWRVRTHKRGKRFHRGGASTLQEKITRIKNESIQNKENLTFDYKRTDGLYRFSEPRSGVFDVYINSRKQVIDGIYLLRHDEKNPETYDKYLFISGQNWIKDYSKMVLDGYDDSDKKSGTYTFPVSLTNAQSCYEVDQLIKEITK